jgi:3-deoxy-manno-octulosonate cytidylyltransferase (CMP-KDO synthetase)
MFRVVIPARYASSRLPGKVLLNIGGKPMIQRVYERACASRAHEVLIATDDPQIVNAAHAFGVEAIMTSPSHKSGTDRIAEVARAKGWGESEIVVNVQGDEPMIPPALIDQVGSVLESNPSAMIATLATPVTSIAEFMDPNAVKVVTDGEGRALYFSRAPIPWDRDGAAAGPPSQKSFAGARRHVGIYGYRVGGLLRLASLEPSPLEQRERLEQLRALENGFEIRVADCLEQPGPDVNTAADLERLSALLRR